MNFLDKHGLGVFLAQLKDFFGFKSNLDKSMEARRTYLLEIDYEKDLAFNTSQIVGNNSPYVGSATVGYTYVA